MPNNSERPATPGGDERSYWLQVLRAGHWRNLETLTDAAEAMVRTGTLADSADCDAIRLLESRFSAEKGQTEFYEIVAYDVAGARFVATTGQRTPDHTRMDLAGTIAPLLPPVDALTAQNPVQTATGDTFTHPAFHHGRTGHVQTVPARRANAAAIADDGLLSKRRPQSGKQATRPHGMRARLLAGVMVGAFAAGMAISALSPEQSGRIAAVVHDRIGTETGKIRNQLAALIAPKSKDAPQAHTDPQRNEDLAAVAQIPVPPAAMAAPEKAIPVARNSGTLNIEAPDAGTSNTGTSNTGTSNTGATRETEAPAQYRAAAAPSGKDLEAENPIAVANLVAAAPAIPVTLPSTQPLPTAPPPTLANAGATPVAEVSGAETTPPISAADAYAMQAALQEPARTFIPAVPKDPVGPAQTAGSADDGLRLAVPGTATSSWSQAAFTTAVAGDPVEVGSLLAHPRPPRKPPLVKARAAYRAALAETIEHGTPEDLVKLITSPTTSVAVASLSPLPADSAATDLTALMDFALLQGRPDHATALAEHGAQPSSGILSHLTRSTDTASLQRIAPIARQIGIDPDRLSDTGMTPLMQAAYNGDTVGVTALLALGADPAFEADNGIRAADLAARANHADVQEMLVVAADQALYAPIMFGLTWSDTLETVQSKSEVCKQVGEGFVACSLKASAWLDDTAAIIAQFDTRNGNRLVAIQVDSHLYDNPDDAEVGFKRAAQLIAKVLPPDQFGFPVRDIPAESGVFHSLTPSVGTGQYFQYWPDGNLSRPVYVHMKMIGYKQDRGFNRIVIGNPFRVG